MQAIMDKARNIRLVIFDVDGILTSGTLFYDKNGAEMRDFHVHDGQGMKSLQQSGVPIAIISARQSEGVTKRMQDLGIQYVFQGQEKKLTAYEKLKQQLNLEDNQIAYMGDDLPDLLLLNRVGLSVTAANAPLFIRNQVDWVTQNAGGKGAARELCDVILHAQNNFQSIVDTYLKS